MDSWFDFVKTYNNLIKESEQDVKISLGDLLKTKLHMLDGEEINEKNSHGRKVKVFSESIKDLQTVKKGFFASKRDIIWDFIDDILKKENIKDSKGYYYLIESKDGVEDIFYIYDSGMCSLSYIPGHSKPSRLRNLLWTELLENYFYYGLLSDETENIEELSFIMSKRVKYNFLMKKFNSVFGKDIEQLLNKYKISIKDNIYIDNLKIDNVVKVLKEKIDKKDLEEIQRLNMNIINNLTQIKEDIKQLNNQKVWHFENFPSLNNRHINLLLEKLKFFAELLILRDLMISLYLEDEQQKAYDVKLNIEKSGLLNTEFELQSIKTLNEIKDSINNLNLNLSETLDQIRSNQDSINTKLSKMNEKMNYSLTLQTINTLQLAKISNKLSN